MPTLFKLYKYALEEQVVIGINSTCSVMITRSAAGTHRLSFTSSQTFKLIENILISV